MRVRGTRLRTLRLRRPLGHPGPQIGYGEARGHRPEPELLGDLDGADEGAEMIGGAIGEMLISLGDTERAIIRARMACS